jgi:predicted alpha/beta superfamily hydrolase
MMQMVRFFLLLSVMLLAAYATPSTASAQARASRSVTTEPGYGYPFDTFTIRSAYVDQVYEIHVVTPPHEPGARLPVLYFPDDDLFFDQIASLTRNMGASAGLPPIIIVGIGYPGDALSSNAGLLRARDLVSLSGSGLETFRRHFGEAALQSTPNLGVGASDFLNFIGRELIPIIERRYPVDPRDRAYFGYSAAGGFGEYVLTHEPDLFQRYITGSNYAAWWRPDRERWWRERGDDPLHARWFFGLGQDEDVEIRGGQTEINTQAEGFFDLAAMLEREQIAGLQYAYRLYPDGTHGATTIGPLFLDGLRAVYLRPGCKPYLRLDADCFVSLSASLP